MSFIHASFLAAGLAIAVPVLLHLNRRRKYVRVRIGSLQFLHALVRRRNRMSRVEQWPLLLLRCLALLLLALLFARPYFRRPAPPAPRHGEMLLLLDASGSISPAQAEEIRRQASSFLGSLNPQDHPVIAAVADKVVVLPSLNDYRPVPGAAGNYAAAIDWVVDRAAASPGGLAGTHWFTDLQRAGLPGAPDRLWPSYLPAKIHAVKAEAPRNVWIEQVDLLTPFNSGEWELQARIKSCGDANADALRVRLTTADGLVAEATTPPSGGIASFKFPGAAKNQVISGSIAILNAGDAWAADDSRPFAFQTVRPKRIVLVDGDPGNSRFTSESYFLEKALHASSGGVALSPFRATVAAEIPAVDPELDVIALCNLPSLSAAQTQLLKSHLAGGTGLAIFMGNQISPSFWAQASSAGLVPSGLTAVPPAAASFSQVDSAHPAASGLTRESLRALQLLPLQRRVTWTASEEWPSVLSFEDGSPLLAVSPKRIAVMAQQINREDSQFPLDPSFVPIMQGLFRYLCERPHASAVHADTITSITPSYGESRTPGLYPDASGVTVLSPSAGESDVTPLDEPAFRRALGIVEPEAVLVAPSAELQGSASVREGELWPWFAALLLALLAIESVAAMRPATAVAAEPQTD